MLAPYKGMDRKKSFFTKKEIILRVLKKINPKTKHYTNPVKNMRKIVKRLDYSNIAQVPYLN